MNSQQTHTTKSNRSNNRLDSYREKKRQLLTLNKRIELISKRLTKQGALNETRVENVKYKQPLSINGIVYLIEWMCLDFAF